jgi:hypothetical protein
MTFFGLYIYWILGISRMFISEKMNSNYELKITYKNGNFKKEFNGETK